MTLKLAVASFVMGLVFPGHGSLSPGAASAQEPGAAAPLSAPVERQASEYRRLVDQVKRGDLAVDFARLRAAWAADPCVGTATADRAALVKAFGARDWAKAVELAQRVLDDEFGNRDMHQATAEAYRELNQPEKQQYHVIIAEKLLQAILASGDGLTPGTAYRVFSRREEALVMRELGYQSTTQSVVVTPKGRFDVLVGADVDNKAASFFFDINGVLSSRPSGPCVK